MIDVIIPNRNAPQALTLTLMALWGWAWTDQIASVVLVDNCSTDREVWPIYGMASSRPRHAVVCNEANVGVWNSINRGLALTRSEFALILTSDVLLGPHVIDVLSDMLRAYSDIKLGILGPEVHTGIGRVPALACAGDRYPLDSSTYNGACWMLRRSLLETIGWYDPSFLVCYGDTDYMERCRLSGVRYGVARGLPCVHLDKQSRRAEGTAAKDTVHEIADANVFRRKWQDYPEVLARHRPVDAVAMAQWKERDLGGWTAARVQ